MLERRERVRFDRGASRWIRTALARENVRLLPVTADIAIRAAEVFGAVPEPADALIYASGLEHETRIVTRDSVLHAIDPTPSSWEVMFSGGRCKLSA